MNNKSNAINENVLKKNVINDVNIKKVLTDRIEAEKSFYRFFCSVKGKIIVAIIGVIAITLPVCFAILFHKFGYFIYAAVFLFVSLYFLTMTKKDFSLDIKISDKKISILEKALRKPHIEYNGFAITKKRVIELATFDSIRFSNIAWVYLTDESTLATPTDYFFDLGLAAAKALNGRIYASGNNKNIERTVLVLETYDGTKAIIRDHFSYKNGFKEHLRLKRENTFNCSDELKELASIILERCPDNVITGFGEKQEKRYRKRVKRYEKQKAAAV